MDICVGAKEKIFLIKGRSALIPHHVQKCD
jgi:hypothetical protein